MSAKEPTQREDGWKKTPDKEETSLGKIVSIAEYRKHTLESELSTTLKQIDRLISRFDVLGLEEMRRHAVQAFNEISIIKTKIEEFIEGKSE